MKQTTRVQHSQKNQKLWDLPQFKVKKRLHYHKLFIGLLRWKTMLGCFI